MRTQSTSYQMKRTTHGLYTQGNPHPKNYLPNPLMQALNALSRRKRVPFSPKKKEGPQTPAQAANLLVPRVASWALRRKNKT